MASRKGHSVPDSWGVEKGGKSSENPEKILESGGLLPLGGTEISGGYKGYGLCSLVEIFCGILGGAHWGPNVRKWMSSSEDADLGQCFIAIDPNAFAPGFSGRLEEFLTTMRNLPQVEDGKAVEVPGDMERRHEELVASLGGIPYHPNQIQFADALADKLGIEKLKRL
ncbi:unnamed protein product [Auanema sp. JU1783]|nr:unnamed protein product [Auanema sp. JU1783]